MAVLSVWCDWRRRRAIAIARGEKKPAKLFVPPELEVRAIRAKLGQSQEDFSSAFGFTVHQIRQPASHAARSTTLVRLLAPPSAKAAPARKVREAPRALLR
jgi:hypothetical protein